MSLIWPGLFMVCVTVLSMLAAFYTSISFANWFWTPRWACWFVLWCVFIRDTFGFITEFSSGCLFHTTFVNHCYITLKKLICGYWLDLCLLTFVLSILLNILLLLKKIYPNTKNYFFNSFLLVLSKNNLLLFLDLEISLESLHSNT